MRYAYLKQCPILGSVTVTDTGNIAVYPKGKATPISRNDAAAIVDALIKAAFKARDIQDQKGDVKQAQKEKEMQHKAEAKLQKELDDGYERGAHRLRMFMSGYDQAVSLRTNADRERILAKLNDTDKTYFLEIEEKLHDEH